jgi:hypothetical protein
MNALRKSAFVCGVLGAGFAGLLAAAELPKEGSYDLTACNTRVINRVMVTDVRSISSYEQFGTSLSNPPGGMFDNGAAHCVGAATAINGQAVDDTMYCMTVYPDGGKILRRFTKQPDGMYRPEVIEATGKYAGIVIEGTAKPSGRLPTVKADVNLFCSRQTGTYTLK